MLFVLEGHWFVAGLDSPLPDNKVEEGKFVMSWPAEWVLVSQNKKAKLDMISQVVFAGTVTDKDDTQPTVTSRESNLVFDDQFDNYLARVENPGYVMLGCESEDRTLRAFFYKAKLDTDLKTVRLEKPSPDKDMFGIFSAGTAYAAE